MHSLIFRSESIVYIFAVSFVAHFEISFSVTSYPARAEDFEQIRSATAMKPSLGIVLAAVAFASLGGCAAVTKEQCIAGDWADLGKAHASVGKPASQLDEVVRSCGKHGITPDTEAYLSGWNRGLLNYCTPMNGFTLGKQYKRRSPICPPQMALDFNRAYELGYSIWKANDNVRRGESKIRSHEDRADEVRDKLDSLTCEDKEKDDLKECRKKRRNLRKQLNDAEYDLETARYNVEVLRAEASFVLVSTNAEAARLFFW